MGFIFQKQENSFSSPSSTPEIAEPANQGNSDVILKVILLASEGKFETAIKEATDHGLSDFIPPLKQLRSIFQENLEKSVSVAVDLAESTSFLAKIHGISSDINHRSQGMAAAIEELSASSGSILNTAQNASQLADQMISNVGEGISASNSLKRANDDIESVVANTDVKVAELVKSTEEIHRILRMITEISERTKLLSLNATIEAARAGEAGKGFAVVASEVKSLAEQTATSADDIKSKVESLTGVTQEISELMKGVSGAVATGREKLDANQSAITNIQSDSEHVSEQMKDILTILKDQDIAVSEISSNVNSIADRTAESVDLVAQTLDSANKADAEIANILSHFPNYELDHTIINLAKSDHVGWKKRLACMAAGRLSIDANGLTDHRGCRLGKWYYSEAADAYKGNPAFREMEAAHIEVHKHGILAAKKYNAHDLEGALEEIGKVDAASHEVLHYLDILGKHK